MFKGVHLITVWRVLAHKSEPPRRVILFGCPGHNGWNTTTKGKNTREEKEAADVATLLEALIVSERQSRRVTRAKLGLRPEPVFNGGIMELPVREYESLRGISCLDGGGWGIGIVDDSVSDMRFRGYCEDVNLTEACLLTIIM